MEQKLQEPRSSILFHYVASKCATHVILLPLFAENSNETENAESHTSDFLCSEMEQQRGGDGASLCIDVIIISGEDEKVGWAFDASWRTLAPLEACKASKGLTSIKYRHSRWRSTAALEARDNDHTFLLF